MWEFQLYLFVFGLLATRGVSGFYYGLNAGVTPAAAESYCQSIGLRLAVLETLAEYEEAKTFLENYQAEYQESGDNVWIGLERDLLAPTHIYKWTDGTPLTYASFGTYPWKDASTSVDDQTKTCIRLDWGSELKFEPYDCTESMDFLCEGFHLVTPYASWNTAKSGCEGINMRLASLSNANANEAAEQFIKVKRRIDPDSYNRVWFGIKCVSGTYYYDDGSGAVTYGSDDENSPWDSGEPSGCECGALRRYGSDGGHYKWTEEACGNYNPYLCKDEFVPVNITTTTPISTTTTAISETTTKPWWFVEYSDDGKALGKNGLTFDKSTPPARFGFIGMAIGFSVFSFIIAVICMLWFWCIKSKDDYRAQEDSDDEEEEEKRKKVAFTAISAKPHGLQYIA
ncbi:uncharacterized protein LOC128163763 [Crassostrea angulata]|uniref:uncharacterized protein LOC128163763 n=1 Tax=Magallana angulata TaxID=2784310 RepID=UPI0022B12951|nr:uncharacterized protein LOC128163763 [Crassostrea angulata]